MHIHDLVSIIYVSPTYDQTNHMSLSFCSLYMWVSLQTEEAIPLMFIGTQGSKIFTM